MLRLLTALLIVIALALGGVLAFRTVLAPLGGTSVDARPPVPNEVLIGDDGRERRLSDWNGETRLVFFGFTRCPDVCPVTLGTLARAYERLTPAQREQLKVVFVTVDPGFDTPEQLRAYLNKFNPDFAGLTGSGRALAKMRQGFYISFGKAGAGNFVHGDSVAVVDPRGQMRRVYGQNDVASGTLARDLPRLASERY